MVIGVLLAFGIPMICLSRSVHALAGNTTGYAWGENLGWMNFGTDGGSVTVSDNAVTGFVWSQSFGWINLGPFANATGVRNDGQGVLDGYAWSEQLGWVHMAGVHINTDNGVFVGTANAEQAQAGRVSFDCLHCRVVTTWRPRRAGPDTGGGHTPLVVTPASYTRPAASSGLGSGGGNVVAAPAALFDVTAKRVFIERWSWAWIWALCLALLLGLSWWLYHRTRRQLERGPHDRLRRQTV